MRRIGRYGQNAEEKNSDGNALLHTNGTFGVVPHFFI